MSDGLKLLAVFAHPDDESMGMGGTLARYSAEGVEIYLIGASSGERGWSSPRSKIPARSDSTKFARGSWKTLSKN